MKKTLLLSALVSICCASGAEPSPEEASSKALVARFFKEVWNAPYRMETIDEIVAPDFAITTDGKSITGRDAFKKWVQEFQSKMSDLKVEPEEMFATADGKRVVTRMKATGRNKGLFGTPADGAPVDFVAISIIEVEGGKLKHNWVERSAYELFRRLSGK